MELCPACGALSADGADQCSCGHQLTARAKIHPEPVVDEARVEEIRRSSRKDLRNGTALVVGLTLLSLVLFAVFDLRPRIMLWVALFWGCILLIRGLRLRREAWQLEHLGFIARERNAAEHDRHH